MEPLRLRFTPVACRGMPWRDGEDSSYQPSASGLTAGGSDSEGGTGQGRRRGKVVDGSAGESNGALLAAGCSAAKVLMKLAASTNLAAQFE